MAECSCSQSGTAECDIASLQQCFERLYSSPPLVSSMSTQQSVQNCHRSPLPYPLFPLRVILILKNSFFIYLFYLFYNSFFFFFIKGSEEMVRNCSCRNVR